jgi:hypothetical protein
MAVADPLVITVNAVAKSLNKINQDGFGSEFLFRDATTEYRAKVRHSTQKPNADGLVYERHNFEVVRKTFATTGVPEKTETFYFVSVRLAEQTDEYLPNAIAALMVASSSAFMTQLHTWQS